MMSIGRREVLVRAGTGVVLALSGPALPGALATWTSLAPAAEAQTSGRWMGTSTGGGPECSPVTFELETRGGTISGRATSSSRPGQPVEWQATGFVASGGRVELITSTTSARVSADRQSITWTGEISRGQLTLSQRASIGCGAPRSAILTPR